MGRSINVARAFVRARWLPSRAPQVQPSGPVETLAGFEANFAERNVLGLTLEQARQEAERELAGAAPNFPGYSFGLSTGSTGRPGVFLTSERERDAWLGAILGKFLPLQLLLNGADIALVLKHNNSLYAGVTKTRWLRLHYFNAAEPVDEWVESLCRLAPAVLVGPVSLLEQVASSGAFAKRPWRPQLLLAGAEPLFPQDRVLLQCAYGVAPRVIYQAKEGFLGVECMHGGIHLNEDLLQFERISLAKNRFVPVITDFTRKSQRYRRVRLDDILIQGQVPCKCGSPHATLEGVEGRANDVLLLEDGPLFPWEVNGLLAPHLKGKDYRVTQVDGRLVTFAVEGGAAAGALAALEQGIGLRVGIEAYEAPAPGEKRRRIRRMFDVQNGWLNDNEGAAPSFVLGA